MTTKVKITSFLEQRFGTSDGNEIVGKVASTLRMKREEEEDELNRR